MFDLKRGALTRLSTDSGEDFNPIWSPDGQWIAFASEMSGTGPQAHLMRPDGSEAQRLEDDVLQFGEARIPLSWSSDGRFLAMEGRGDIWVFSFDEPEGSRAVLDSEFREHGASFSPDGKWLAYHSDESGRDQVYVQPFPGPGAKKQVSSDGGSWPHWDGSGATLFYRSGNRVFAVDFENGTDLELSPPRVLFTGRYGYGIGHSNYHLSSEGRFLMVEVDQPPPLTRLVLVTNWFEELKRLVPTD